MSQMNPKEVFHNTAYSVQLPYIAGHSMFLTLKIDYFHQGFYLTERMEC